MARNRSRGLIAGKFGTDLASYASEEQLRLNREWEVKIPNEIKNVQAEYQTAPTTNPKKPRALTLGYNPNTNVLVVVFRDNTWWQYNDVPVEMWLSLKNSQSTGRYLRESGLDVWSDMGPADMDALSEGVKAQLSQAAQSASDIQSGKDAEERSIKNIKNIQSFSAEELFRDYL